MRLLVGLVGLFMLVTLPVGAATVDLSEKDNGAVLNLQPGDKIAVTLRGNPTTGYTWNLDAISVDILAPESEPKYVRDADLLGAGGEYTFSFTAQTRGYTKVIFAYLRTWETGTPPAKTFTMTVDVNSPEEKKPVTTVRYLSKEGTALTASFDPNANQVQLTLPDKQTVLLPAAIAASGARYSNAYETFWEHHGTCTYTKGDKVVFTGTVQP